MGSAQAVILTLLVIFLVTTILYYIVTAIVESFARKITRVVMEEIALLKGRNK